MSQDSLADLTSAFGSVSQNAWESLYNSVDFGLLNDYDVAIVGQNAETPNDALLDDAPLFNYKMLDDYETPLLDQNAQTPGEGLLDGQVCSSALEHLPTANPVNRRSASDDGCFSEDAVTSTMLLEQSDDYSPLAEAYNFELSFDTMTDVTKKTALFNYSSVLKKLFAKVRTSCPVVLNVEPQPPPGTMVHVCLTYAQAEYAQEPVERCKNHAVDPAGETVKHVVQCANRLSTYYTDEETGFHVVRVPWAALSNDCIGASICVLSFSCFNSCQSINRRMMQLHFTLELNNCVIARQKVLLKVCASPFRDAKVENDALKNMQNPKNERALADGAEARRVPVKRSRNDLTSLKDDDKIYTLKVKGRRLYKTLLNIAHVHYMASNVASAYAKHVLDSLRHFSPEVFVSIKQESSIGRWLRLLGKSRYAKAFAKSGLRKFADVEAFNKEAFLRLGVSAEDADFLTSWLIHRATFDQQRQLSSSEPSDQSGPKRSTDGSSQDSNPGPSKRMTAF